MDICVQTGNVVVDLGFEEGYRKIKEAGFQAIDWNIDHALSPKKIKTATQFKDICIFEKSLEEVLAYYENTQLCHIRKNGLTISQAHAPFPAYLPGREDILDYMISIYNRVIELCDAVGCKNLVVHGISLPAKCQVDSPERIKALNMKLYRGMIDTLKHTNVTVCLENLFTGYSPISSSRTEFTEGVCSNPYEAVEYIDTLNAEAGKECFGFCLDTGHLHLLRKNFLTYIPVLGKRIKCLHIHDNDATFDKHTAPFTGSIPWSDFIVALRQIGYDHDLSFETFRQTNVALIGKELVPTFLKMIYEIGIDFRRQITENV